MAQLVSVTFGVDVPAYLTRNVVVPTGVDLEQYLKEHGESLTLDCEPVFEPDWEQQSSLRVVTASDAVSGKTLAEDVGIDPSPYDRGLLASEVLKRHWSLIVQKLPCDVVGQLAEVLER